MKTFISSCQQFHLICFKSNVFQLKVLFLLKPNFSHENQHTVLKLKSVNMKSLTLFTSTPKEDIEEN